jgi:hypothetical protein
MVRAHIILVDAAFDQPEAECLRVEMMIAANVG